MKWKRKKREALILSGKSKHLNVNGIAIHLAVTGTVIQKSKLILMDYFNGRL